MGWQEQGREQLRNTYDNEIADAARCAEFVTHTRGN